MNTHADKAEPDKSQAIANNLTQQDSRQAFYFSDNRLEAARQRRVQEMADRNHTGVSFGHATDPAVVQRAILAHAGSNAGLKELYDNLCQNVDSIGALTDQIGNAVTIRYGNNEETEGRGACYLFNSRTIVINQNLEGNEAHIRHYILVELNHARLGNAPAAAPQPGNAAELDAVELAKYTTALDALRVEYHEWISAYLTFMETVDANMALNANMDEAEDGEEHEPGPDVVHNRYAAAYQTFGEGFFEFSVYIRMQVGSGHTAVYDATATGDNWAGYEILEIAENDHAALFSITEEQHLQNVASLLANPGAFQGAIAARVNPFAGAPGTALLTTMV